MKDIENKDTVQPDRQWIREELGVVTNEHQICVGITRSKYGLVIAGESSTSLLSARLGDWGRRGIRSLHVSDLVYGISVTSSL